MKNKLIKIIEESYVKIKSDEKLEKYISFCIENDQGIHTVGITEYHHILPKAKRLFPQFSNLKENNWNGTFLTYENHYIAHALLVNAIDNESVIYAWNRINQFSETKSIELIGSKKYKELRENHSKIVTHYNKTRVITHETKLKMGASNKGLVTVFDTVTKKHKKVTKEEFNNNPLLLGGTPGMVSVMDSRDGSTKQVTKKEFEKYDYYIHNTKGLVVAIDIRDGSRVQITQKQFDETEYYYGNTIKKMNIFDKNGEVIHHLPRPLFREYAKANKMPINKFLNSAKNNGEIINFEFNRISDEVRAFNKGHLKFVGWYSTLEDY